VRLFRKKTRIEEAAPTEAAAPEALEVTSPPRADEQTDKTKPRRRRGSRGGRGRGKKKVEAAGSGAKTESKADAKAEPKAAPKPRQPRQRKKDGEEAKPRRKRTQTPRRSSLPKVKKEIFVSVEVTEQRVAVLEDDVVVEVYLGRPSHRSVAGNVYKGIVDNVLPGMEASFVDIGLEKNGFLYVDEIVVPELEGKQRHGRRIQELIERGQEVLVQAVKDPMGTKGARLTTEISLPGRFLVFVPYGDGIGVSRRLEDEERERLKAICKDLELPDGGLIVRTAAEGASQEELQGDLALPAHHPQENALPFGQRNFRPGGDDPALSRFRGDADRDVSVVEDRQDIRLDHVSDRKAHRVARRRLEGQRIPDLRDRVDFHEDIQGGEKTPGGGSKCGVPGIA